MAVFKRLDSKFYQYEFVFEGRRYRGSTKHKNKKAAATHEDILKAKLANSRSGIMERKPIPVFKTFAEEFLKRAKPELRHKSWLRYEVSVRNLEDSFGTRCLDEIRADDIERFKQSRLEKGRSPSTVNRDLACLRRIFSFAVQTEIVSTTPFLARRVRFLRENGRERILTFDEERRYLAVARSALGDATTLILEMGFRPNEACSIRRESVHLHAVSPFVHVPEGKTKNARRDVPVTRRAKEVLRRRLTKADGPYIFPLRVGKGFDWSRPMCELHPAHEDALAESKILPRFQLYDLRHTYGTRAIESGTDPLTLMRLMGHADLKTTMRYVHLSQRHLAEAQVRIERYRAEREIAEAEARRSEAAPLQ